MELRIPAGLDNGRSLSNAHARKRPGGGRGGSQRRYRPPQRGAFAQHGARGRQAGIQNAKGLFTLYP
jgi:hypothetical protein